MHGGICFSIIVTVTIKPFSPFFMVGLLSPHPAVIAIKAFNLILTLFLNKITNEAFLIMPAHSMEEAEYLCDRLGIFVDGSLQCIGNPKEVNILYNIYNLAFWQVA